jgi:hypothetical protein
MANKIIQDAEGAKMVADIPQIYQLIGKAIGMIGAIGKDKKNQQQGFMYRGIDQVYNALNPVLSALGLFFCPEVVDMKREERVNKNGTVLAFTILTVKYTVYAPDGSFVTMTVLGEGMDSGDKGCNKAMSIAYKYALFQLLCIPTDEMKDPDADVYKDVLPAGTSEPENPVQNANVRPQVAAQQASVSTVDKIPAPQEQAAKPAGNRPEPLNGETPGAFIKRRIADLQAERPDFNFVKARAGLIEGGVIEDIPSAVITMDQAKALISAIYANFRKEEKAG